LATQFHPEFRSRPSTPHPLFLGFVKAALQQKPSTLNMGDRHQQVREESVLIPDN
jgi:CTP synthase